LRPPWQSCRRHLPRWRKAICASALPKTPDNLDPTTAGSYVGRIVLAAMCDKLFDIDEKLNIVPQLALAHETSEDGKTVTHQAAAGS
jgi:peptide/nickel transport system substrate-binding protein